MSALSVLSPMPDARHCPHTGLSIPEWSCRACCRELLQRYAPALLNPGPLEQPCCIPSPAIRTAEDYASAHGITVAELRHRSSRLEVRV